MTTAERASVVVLLVLVLATPIGPAAARQMDARDRPRVSGPLDQELLRCKRKRVRPRRRVVAVVKSCIRFYSFRPRAEDDDRRDYGAIWLQVNVDSRRRWCTTSVVSDIVVPAGARRHARAPKQRSTRRRRRVQTTLVVDARGHAMRRDAVVRNGFGLLPRGLRGRARDDGAVWRVAWRGSSGAKLAVASGAEISWRQEDGPPARVNSALRYELRRKRSC